MPLLTRLLHMIEEEEVPALEEEELELDLSEEIEEEETVEDVKARLAKAEELANNYKTRAEKAEARTKDKPKVEKTTDLSTSDLYALMKADVAEEDIADVAEVAKLRKISIGEALKTPIVKSLLAEKAEERSTAEATSTSTARRTTSTLSPEVVLKKAQSGDMPDSDAGLEALFKARKGL